LEEFQIKSAQTNSHFYSTFSRIEWFYL